GTLSGTKTKSATSGVATFGDLSIDKEGVGYTLTAAAVGLTTGSSSTFAITPSGVSAAHSTVAVSPAIITASAGGSAATITVTARDGFGNPLSGVTVALAASGSGNTLTQPAGPTDVNGVAMGALVSTVAGTKTVSATAGGVAITQTQDVIVNPAPAKALAFSVQPSATQAGAPIAPAVVVAAQDDFGNAVSSFAGQVTVAIGTNPAGGTLSGTTAKAATAGVATFGDLSIDKQGSGYTLTAGATELTGASSSTFAITAGGVSGAQSTVAVSPAVIAASTGASVTTITVTARDGFGNPVPGVPIVLAASGTGNVLTQPAAPTNASGVATGTLSSTVAETKTVSAMAGVTAITQTQSVTVTAGTATALVFLAPPRDTVAGASLNEPGGVKVAAQDALGNTDNSYTGSITLALAANPAGGTLSGVKVRPGVAGVATFTGLSIDKASPGYALQATATGLTPVTSSPFDISAGPVAPSQSTASALPTSIAASSGSSTSTITVTVKDALGNPVPGATVVLAAAPASGVTLAQPGPTNAAGTTTGTLSSTAAGTKTVTVTANGIQLTQQPAITVEPGPVSAGQSTVTVTSDTIEASSGGITSGIVVTAKDAFGNPIDGVSVAVAATGTGVSLTQPSGTTDPTGAYTGAAVSATTIGNVVVSATAGGVAITQKDTVTVVSGEVSASQSTLVAAPSTVAASSGSGGSTVTITARDDLGNPIAGATVVLSATGTGITLIQPSGPTNASGVATGTLRSTVAEAKIVSATIDGTGLVQTDTVTVTPASADSTAFLVQPSGATAGAIMSPPVEIEIRDRFGNRVTSAANNVTLTLSTNPGGATLTGGGPVAASGGVATFAGLSLDQVATGYRLTATAAGVSKTGASNTFNITSGVVSGAQTAVGASPSTIAATNGSSLSTITVTAKDAGGSAVAGATVVLSASGTGNTLTQPSGPTDANGVATGTLSSTVAGSKTITAVVNGVTITQQPVVTVAAGAISGSQTTILAAPAAIVQTTGVSTISVTVKDAFGNPVSGAAVTLAATGSGNSLTQPSGPTGATGIATGTLSSSVLGNKVVTATAGGVPLTHSDTVIVIAPGSSAVLVGAGDIAVCGKQDDEATAAVVTQVLTANPGAEVFTLGDNAYEKGRLTEFINCYGPSWGAFKSVTHPSAGNHDYNTTGAAGYYQYFGAAAGDSGKGYYSYDFGAWHVIVLNSEISTSASSPQLQWLQADLASHSNVCTLAYFHQPLYSSIGGTAGTTGATISSVRTFWDALYAAGADLVLSGHRHVYERLARMAPDGSPDPTNGIREIIVGTGGDSGGDLTNIFPTSEVREGRTYGVIKLTLSQTSYSWQFLPAAGGTFTDAGTESCH
ncbi:MAG TPA: Ig-like domain-containing protein, partial [Gemmatimonadales bacterium]|nr:Ig-like domain-containing protein [Gemmatimonadales bacterium]